MGKLPRPREGGIGMFRPSRIGGVLVIALALSGCAQKSEQANETASDSLLAANPVEPPQTGITPQTEYQPEQQQKEPPPAPKPVAETPAKPAEPAVPEEMQAAAQNLLGKETQVLIFGDLAKNGKQQFLAANVVPKTPKNQLPGTIVTRAVIAENTDGQWSELLRCDEYLKNSKGYLALTPLAPVAGWRVQYDQDPVKGIQLYFTALKGTDATDAHVLPIGIAWNPATKRYQSLDRTYEHFLLESPSLSTARSVLR